MDTLISRNQMKGIKRMRKDELNQFIKNVYIQGAADATSKIRITEVNCDKFKNELRELLRSNLGIGDRRFARIEDAIDNMVKSNIQETINNLSINKEV